MHKILKTTTNATVLSDDNGTNSQSRLQSKSVNYYDDSSGYLASPITVTPKQQQKLPAVVVMMKESWLFEEEDERQYIYDISELIEGFISWA
jgi:hypothetical protein